MGSKHLHETKQILQTQQLKHKPSADTQKTKRRFSSKHLCSCLILLLLFFGYQGAQHPTLGSGEGPSSARFRGDGISLHIWALSQGSATSDDLVAHMSSITNHPNPPGEG